MVVLVACAIIPPMFSHVSLVILILEFKLWIVALFVVPNRPMFLLEQAFNSPLIVCPLPSKLPLNGVLLPMCVHVIPSCIVMSVANEKYLPAKLSFPSIRYLRFSALSMIYGAQNETYIED